jgi:hypothetical protein
MSRHRRGPVYGAGAIGSAVFPTDRIDSPADLSSLSATGAIHIGIALASFVCAIAGMFVLTRTFARDDRWRSFPRWALGFPAAALVLLFLQAEGPLVGLMQRLRLSKNRTLTACRAGTTIYAKSLRVGSLPCQGQVVTGPLDGSSRTRSSKAWCRTLVSSSR